MIKNGLFIMSIGFLTLVVVAIGSDASIQNIPLFILSLVIIVVGGLIFYIGTRDKGDLKNKENANENS